MQINFPNSETRRAQAPYWYAPSTDNSLQRTNVPPIYAPYGSYGYWAFGPRFILAPNSGDRTNIVRNSFAPGGSDIAPAANVAEAIITGQPVGPITLTSPMPSITPPRQGSVMPSGDSNCGASSWAAEHPLVALGVAGALYLLLRGGRR